MIWFTDKVHQVHWNYKQHHHSYHQIYEFASRSFEKNHLNHSWKPQIAPVDGKKKATCLQCNYSKQNYLKPYIHAKNVANNQHFPTSRRLEVDLGLDTTFINRKNTNEFVLKTASEFAGREVLLFLDLLLRKRAALAGHILRTNDRACLKQVTFKAGSA